MIRRFRPWALALAQIPLACTLNLGNSGLESVAPQPESMVPPVGSVADRVPARVVGTGFIRVPRATPGTAGGPVLDATFAARLTSDPGTAPIDLDNVVWIDEEHLDVTVPSGIAAAVYDVVVVSPSGQTGLARQVYVATSAPGPVITTVNPPAAVNDDQMPVEVVGDRFDVASARVRIMPSGAGAAPIDLPNDPAATQTATSRKVLVSAGTAPGTYTLSVTNPDRQRYDHKDPFRVVTPAMLGLKLTAPATVSTGQSFTLTGGVDNAAGGSAAQGVTLDPVVLQGTASATVGTAGKVDVAVAATVPLAVAAQATGRGTARFSTRAVGVNEFSRRPVASAVASTADVAIQDAAALAAAVSARPGRASLGQDITVEIAVRNGGEATAQAVSPTAPTLTGNGAATLKSGPTPATPPDIAGGQTQTFTYVYTASQVGGITFAAGALGRDINSGATVTAPAATSSIVAVENPAALRIASVAVPARANVGQTFTVAMVVNNDGQAAASAVAPSALVLSVPGAASLISGPTPGSAGIAGGASATFQWTYRADAKGLLTLTGDALGTDANSALPVRAQAATSGTVTIQSPAALTASLSIPANLTTGQTFTATMIVVNSGDAAASGVLPSPLSPTASGTASATTATVPTAQAIPGGGSATFTWTYAASGTGTLTLTVGAAGTDANTGGAVTAAAVASNTANVLAPSSLVITAFSAPATVTRTQTFTVSMTVQNNGGTQVNVVAPSPSPPTLAKTLGADASTSSAVTPVDIPPSQSATFQWTWSETGTGPGTLAFTAGAAGTDSVSGQPVNANPTQSNLVQVQSPPVLVVESIGVPVRVSRGQTFTAAVTVRNTGGATANGVLPSPKPPAVTGTTGANAATTSTPAAANIAGGGTASFAYAYTENGTGTGTLVLSTGATGTDANRPAVTVTAPSVSSAAITVQTPAALSITAFVLPASLSSGQSFALSLTVANTGQTTATSVLPAPNPPTINKGGTASAATTTALTAATIAGGTSQTFTWVYTENGTGPGTLAFTGAAAGTDANSGLSVDAPNATSNTATVVLPANLVVDSFAILPATMNRGATFTATLTIRNTGGAAANSVVPVPSPPTPTFTLGAGATTSTLVGAKNIAGGGGTASYSWSYTENGSGGGTIQFSAGATGTDANSGGTVNATAAPSNTAAVQTPAALAINSFTLPAVIGTSAAFSATMVVANTGQAAANAVISTPNAPTVVAGGSASATGVAAASQTVAGGTTVSFTWSYTTGAGTGTITLNAGLTGTDANTGGALNVLAQNSNTGTVATAAALSSTLVGPAAAVAGEQFDLIMNVANTGGTAANSVQPQVPLSTTTTGTVNAAAVTTPAAASLAAGTNRDFGYVYSTAVADNGSVTFSGNATGTDAASGNPVSSPSTSSSAVGIVLSPGQLSAALRLRPTVAALNDQVGVEMVVTNTSGAALPNVAPSSLSLTGPGQVSALSGPSPTSVASLAAGGQVTFGWTYRATGYGWVRFTGHATSTAPQASRPARSVALAIRAPSCLVSTVSANAGADTPATACGTAVSIGGSPAASGGNSASYSHDWSPTTGLTTAAVANPLASPDVADSPGSTALTYTLSVTDADGCQAQDSMLYVFSGMPTTTGVTTNRFQDKRCTTGTFTYNANCAGCASCVWTLPGGSPATATGCGNSGAIDYNTVGTHVATVEGRNGACRFFARRPVFVGTSPTGGFDTAAGRLTLTPSAGSALANGTDTISFASNAISDCANHAAGAASGMRFTVLADRGAIVEADIDVATPGLQLNQSAVGGGGFGVNFTLRADRVGGAARVRAEAVVPASSQARGWASVSFTGSTSLPRVTEFFPAGAATARYGRLVGAAFDKGMDGATATATTFTVRDVNVVGGGTCAAPSGATVAGAVSYQAGTAAALFDSTPLDVANLAYLARLVSGAAGVLDANGKELDGNANATADGTPGDDFNFCFGRVADITAPTASCTSVAPATISPDGDGTNDVATVSVNVNDGAALSAWRAIVGPTGAATPVRVLYRQRTTNGADAQTWDGRGADGQVVPNGTYGVSVQSIDAVGNFSTPCNLTVSVQNPVDLAQLSPP